MTGNASLGVSIVLYNTCYQEIEGLVRSLHNQGAACIYIIDNSPLEFDLYDGQQPPPYIITIRTGINLGYGRAHNIALRDSMAKHAYHIVCNPDILVPPSTIEKLLLFMDENPAVGQMMPKIYYPNNDLQYLCKLIPTPLDLLLKRFLPERLRAQCMERFELKFTGYNEVMDVPYLSGCFMLFRTSALKEIGLFDERYFMYPEDIDLTRRMHQKHRTIFYPDAFIVHAHAANSYESLYMLCIHIFNLIKYFNKWGWIFDEERKNINRKILNQLNYH